MEHYSGRVAEVLAGNENVEFLTISQLFPDDVFATVVRFLQQSASLEEIAIDADPSWPISVLDRLLTALADNPNDALFFVIITGRLPSDDALQRLLSTHFLERLSLMDDIDRYDITTNLGTCVVSGPPAQLRLVYETMASSLVVEDLAVELDRTGVHEREIIANLAAIVADDKCCIDSFVLSKRRGRSGDVSLLLDALSDNQLVTEMHLSGVTLHGSQVRLAANETLRDLFIEASNLGDHAVTSLMHLKGVKGLRMDAPAPENASNGPSLDKFWQSIATTIQTIHLEDCEKMTGTHWLEGFAHMVQHSQTLIEVVLDLIVQNHPSLELVRRLARMKSLRIVDFLRWPRDGSMLIDELLNSLRDNEFIKYVEGPRFWGYFPCKLKDEFHFYLKLNRRGRRLLHTKSVKNGFWPLILALSTGGRYDDPSVLYYMLRRRADLLCYTYSDRARQLNAY